MRKSRLKRCILAGILILAFMLVFPWGIRAERLFADLVVLDANIITLDHRYPRAEALAAKDGKFVAVGSTSQIRELVGKDTKVMDVQGKTVTPGFIDAHCHPRPIYPVTSRLGRVDLSPKSVRTMDDLINALTEKARITPKGE